MLGSVIMAEVCVSGEGAVLPVSDQSSPALLVSTQYKLNSTFRSALVVSRKEEFTMSFAGFKKQINKANQFVSEKMGSAEGTKMEDEFVELERKTDVMTNLVTQLLGKTKEYLQPNPAVRAKIYMHMAAQGACRGESTDQTRNCSNFAGNSGTGARAIETLRIFARFSSVDSRIMHHH